MSREREWHVRGERGSMLGMQITSWLYRRIGRAVAMAVLYPVVAYFFLTDRDGRKASHAYLQRLYETPNSGCVLRSVPGSRDVFRHFLEFGVAILDRAGFWLGGREDFQLTVDGMEHLDRIAEEKRGALILGSHLGSFDAMRLVAAKRSPIAVSVLMYTEHAPRINDLLSRTDGGSDEGVSVRVIRVQPGSLAHALEAKASIERGEVVAVLADRLHPNERDRFTKADFLGASARFPSGPFLLANALRCPVLLMVALRDGPGRYRIHVEPFEQRLRIPRSERDEALSHYCQRYADRIAYYCSRAPYQWFNFYDFWAGEKTVGGF